MEQNLISIITPTWNSADMIGETIASVQAQSYGQWELIITDDGSGDETYELLQEAAAKDSRIKVSRQENAGPAMARQNALGRASGRYIAFLDSDDLWLPEKLESQLSFMKAREITFSYTSFRRIDETGTRLGHRIQIPAQISYGRLLGNTAIATSTVMIDKQKSGPFSMVDTYYDDFVLWLDLLKRETVGMAYGLDQDLMRYRVLSHSVSRNKGKSAKKVWQTYREIEHLSYLRSAWSFFNYAVHAVIKYRKF